MHQVFAIYERMVLIGAWERLGLGGILLLVGMAWGVLLSIEYVYEARHSEISKFDFGVYMVGWVLYGVVFVVGLVIGLIGVSHLLDPGYRVIQLLLHQAPS